MKMIKILSCIISLSLISFVYPQQVKQRYVRAQKRRSASPARGQRAAAARKRPAKVIQKQQQQLANIVQQQPNQLVKAQDLKVPQAKDNYGITTAQNKRAYQEDRFDQREIIAIRKGDFFAIYDGHGGDKASSFLQKNLATYFTESLLRKPSVEDAFGRAFFRAEMHALHQFDDGSTVIAAFIDEKNILHLAWVGDSRAVLEKNGTVGFATQDHKPDSKDEQDRIKKAGGTIQKHGVWRINGLAVSRSIGDRRLKEMGKDQIIAIPEYATMQLDADNHFLILASDGLWDVVSNQTAIDFVKKEFTTTSDLSAIATDLQNEAIKQGSEDNITICIIKLKGQKRVNLAKKQEALKEPANSSYWTRFWNWLRGKK